MQRKKLPLITKLSLVATSMALYTRVILREKGNTMSQLAILGGPKVVPDDMIKTGPPLPISIGNT